MGKKRVDSIRLCFQNTNGLPLYSAHGKNGEIYQFLENKEVDVMAMSETNVCWHKLVPEHRWKQRTRSWFRRSGSTLGYIANDPIADRFQRGGTGIMNIGAVTRRFRGSGTDHLGRWCWVRLAGKKGKTIRIISIYKPTRNVGKGLSTYSQQRRMLQAQDDDRCPIIAFWEDFWNALDKWIESGDHIVVGGDFNEDTTNQDLVRKFRNRGMQSPILEKHPSLRPPPTRKGGSKTIDNIFASEELKPTKAGFLPFDQGIPSDHRLAWLEFNTRDLFRAGKIGEPEKSPRRLALGNPRAVQKYISNLRTYMEHHRVKDKIVRLQQMATSPLSEEAIEELEALDRIRLEGIRYAEKKCRQLRLGSQQWTPTRAKIRKEIELWNLLIKQKTGKKHNVKKIRRLSKSLHKPRLDHLDLLSMETFKNRALQKWRIYVKTLDTPIRESWLEATAEYLEEIGKGDKSKILKSLLNREKQRQATRRINQVLKAENRIGVTTVCTVENRRRLECTTKKDIEEACLSENLRRFTQALGTTFTLPHIVEKIGHLGITQTCDDILAGQEVQLPLTTDQLKFVKFLTRPQVVNAQGPISNSISVQQWRRCWKSQKEHTSSGPSGIHFGNMKANSTDDLLGYIDALLTNIPFSTGYSLKRWQNGTNVMLYKKSMDNDVAKLRTILLYEADFNAANKIIGREMLANGERCKSIAKEQYGSRKNKSAILQCFNKKLTLDIWRQTRSTGAILSNDAKSCYDRILHNVASMCMQRQGVHRNNIVCMFTTIQRLRHTVRTAFGDSATGFHRDIWLAPLHGVGQGNGAGPAIWAVVSSPILDMLREESSGAFFKCAISGSKLKIVGFSFVDDTDLVLGGSRISKWEVADELQHALDIWQVGIEATGGALVPEKSFWSEIQFEWDTEGNWTYESTESNGQEVMMHNARNETKILKKLDAHKAIETLGVHLAPDGNESTQIEAMLVKAHSWASKMQRRGLLEKRDAWTGFTTTILKTLGYPLPVTCLSERDSQRILAPTLNVALPAMGIARRFRREFIQGPFDCMGLGIPSLYTMQGAAHIDLVVSHWKENTDTGKLLRCSFENFRLEMGCEGNPLDLPFEEWRHVATDSWFKSTWEFMSKYDIGISINLQEITQRRQNDAFIMEEFHSNGVKPKDLEVLNRCRLYLKAITIADIFETDGRTVLEQAWEGKPLLECRRGIEWPIQERPGQKQWRLWRSSLRRIYSLTNRVSPTVIMGNWMEHVTSHNWQWFYRQRDHKVFRKQGRIVASFKRKTNHRNCSVYCKQEIVRSLPHDVVRCTIRELSRAKVRMLGYGPGIQEQPVRQTLPEGLYIQMEENLEAKQEIISGVNQGDVIAVSDGSFKSGRGTAAFGFYNRRTGTKLRGCLRCPGPVESQSPYRSELVGLAGIIQFVRTLEHSGERAGARVEVACDGKSAINQIFNHYTTPKTNMKHYDIISYCRELLTESTTTWTYRHVKGHKDELTGDLDEWERLNVEMDFLAKRYWQATRGHEDQEWRGVNKGFITVRIDGDCVTSSLQKAIQKTVGFKRWWTWWEKRQQADGFQPGNIDFKSIRLAFATLPINQKIFSMKNAHGTAGVGSWMAKWKQLASAECPRCGHHKEDTVHIWKCKESKKWDSIVVGWKGWMSRNHCRDTDKDTFCTEWNNWRLESNPQTLDSCSAELREAILDQRRIGWDNFSRGFISCAWSDWLESWPSKYHRIQTQSLVKQIWKAGRILWEERNNQIHNSGSIDSNRKRRAIEESIRREFQRDRTGLSEIDTQLYNEPVESILGRSRNGQRDWLMRVHTAQARKRRRLGEVPTNDIRDEICRDQLLIVNWTNRPYRKRKK